MDAPFVKHEHHTRAAYLMLTVDLQLSRPLMLYTPGAKAVSQPIWIFEVGAGPNIAACPPSMSVHIGVSGLSSDGPRRSISCFWPLPPRSRQTVSLRRLSMPS